MYYWFLKTVLLGPLLRLIFRPWAEGLDNIPEHGPAILASNHMSFSDSIFLPLVLPRRVTFLAKSEYFTGRGLRGWLTARFFRGMGQVPVDRSGGRASEAALRTGLRVLRRGQLLGIYPEGTRSPDGRLYRGRTGVARLALEARVTVVPVAMIDTDRLQPPGRLVPRLMRPGVRIGKPLDFARYEGLEGDRFILRSLTDEIVYELMLLSGQEYVDIYATRAKELIAAERTQRVASHLPGQLGDRLSARAARAADEAETGLADGAAATDDADDGLSGLADDPVVEVPPAEGPPAEAPPADPGSRPPAA